MTRIPPSFVGRALVAGMCVAAAAAIAGLLMGSWDDTNWKILGSSLGFSVFTVTASAGTDPRPSPDGEIADIVGRLAAMELPPDAQREVARLRRLTRSAGKRG